MNERIIALTKSKYLPYLFLFILLFVFHFFLYYRFDDVWFRQRLSEVPYLELLTSRYFEWTSRIFIEAALFLAVQLDIRIFGVINSIFILLLIYSMSRLLPEKAECEDHWLLVGLFLVYQLAEMGGAGWAATAVNYVWPAAAGIYALTALTRLNREERIGRWEYPLLIIALLFAANQEQMAALLFGFGVVLTIYRWVKTKKLPPFFIVWNLLTAASLAHILLSPGNQNRTAQEVITWFPEFDNFGVIHKLILGLMNTFNYLFNQSHILYFILVLVLSATAYRKSRNLCGKVLSLVPLGTALITNMDYFTSMRSVWLPHAERFFVALDLQAMPYSGKFTILPFLNCILILSLVLLAIYVAYGKTESAMVLAIVFAAGMASAFIIGFSPTIYASVPRIFFPMQISFIFIISFVYQKERMMLKDSHRKIFLSFVYVMAFFSYFTSLGTVIYIP